MNTSLDRTPDVFASYTLELPPNVQLTFLEFVLTGPNGYRFTSSVFAAPSPRRLHTGPIPGGDYQLAIEIRLQARQNQDSPYNFWGTQVSDPVSASLICTLPILWAEHVHSRNEIL